MDGYRYGGIVWVHTSRSKLQKGSWVIRVVTAVGHAVICGHASSSMDIFIGYNILIGRYIIRCPVQDILLLWSDISNIGLQQTRALTRELSSTFNDVLAFGINTDSWTETQSSYKAVDWEKLSTGDTHNLLDPLPRAQILEHRAPYWSERWYTDCFILGRFNLPSSTDMLGEGSLDHPFETPYHGQEPYSPRFH